jgi:hypothetical protein
LKFSLGHQILDTRIEEQETRRTNREWFSRTLKRPFWSILPILDSFLEKWGFREAALLSRRESLISPRRDDLLAFPTDESPPAGLDTHDIVVIRRRAEFLRWSGEVVKDLFSAVAAQMRPRHVQRLKHS